MATKDRFGPRTKRGEGRVRGALDPAAGGAEESLGLAGAAVVEAHRPRELRCLRDRGVQLRPLVTPDTGQDAIRGEGIGDERSRVGPVVHRVVAVADGVDHLS